MRFYRARYSFDSVAFASAGLPSAAGLGFFSSLGLEAAFLYCGFGERIKINFLPSNLGGASTTANWPSCSIVFHHLKARLSVRDFATSEHQRDFNFVAFF